MTYCDLGAAAARSFGNGVGGAVRLVVNLLCAEYAGTQGGTILTRLVT